MSSDDRRGRHGRKAKPADMAKKVAFAFGAVLTAGLRAARDYAVGTAAPSSDVKRADEEERMRRQARNAAADGVAPPVADVADGFQVLEPPHFVPIMFLDVAKPPKGFQADFHAQRGLIASVGHWHKLTPAICYQIFSYCDVSEVCRMQRVCRAWRGFMPPLLHDRAYLKPCARRGFAENVRGGAWRVLAETKAPDALKRAEFWELVAQQSDRREEIERDIERTLIHYGAFDTDEEAVQALNEMLQAYAVHDADVGYTQGLNFVAAFLLTKLPLVDAYWLMYTLMLSPRFHLRALYLHGLPGLKLCQFQFQQLFQLYHPRLADHFERHGVVADLYTTEWFMTLFTYRAIPPETSARIWDMFLSEGWKAIHRAGLAILSISERTLLLYDFEGIIQYLKFFPDQGVFDANLLIAAACDFKVTNRMLQKLSDRFQGRIPAI